MGGCFRAAACTAVDSYRQFKVYNSQTDTYITLTAFLIKSVMELNFASKLVS